MKYLYALLFIGCHFSSFTFGQKVSLKHSDYDAWKRVSEKHISNDGKNIAYVISPQEGDGQGFIKTNKEFAINRAYDLNFSQDNNILIGKIKPTLSLTRTEKKLKKKKEEMTKDSLFIFQINNSSLIKIPNLISYKTPEKSGNAYAYLIEPSIKKDSTSKKLKKFNEENGFRLVIANTLKNSSLSFDYIKDYGFSKNGKSLAFSSSGKDSTQKAGLYVLDLESGSFSNILNSTGKIHQFSLDSQGHQLACVIDLDTSKKTLDRNPSLFFWKTGQTTAQNLYDKTTLKSSENYVSEWFKPKFSEDGKRLFFGRRPKALEPDTNLLAEDQVKLDVWNYKDEHLMPAQLANLEQEKKRSYLSVFHISENKTLDLGGPNLPNVLITNDATELYFIGINAKPYSNEHWDWHRKHDAYLINVSTGKLTPIYKGNMGENPSLSPSFEQVAYYSLIDTSYYFYDVNSKKTIRITNNKSFTDLEDDDHPDFPSPYGTVGWTKNSLLIKDKYDIWEVPTASPSSLKRLTFGREKNITYQYLKLDPEAKSIDVNQKLLLQTVNHSTYQEGFSILENGKVSDQVISDHQYYFGGKAKNSTEFLFQKANFSTPLELMVGNLNNKEITQLSQLSKQLQNLKWGTVEHVNWQSLDGINLKGLLYKPENFDPNKKYPMITYFYEKSSDDIHNFIEPSPTRSIINFSYFVSNGYLVFVPDIVYKIGYPGESGYNCVIPGVQSIINKGFVDQSKLGIQGHSWGGYQTAYIITKTNLFTAAESGAPVVNMTSAYGGIRWGSGMSRQAQYEYNQSRIGGNLWDKYPLYIENSPLFSLNKVKTPVLILHNDADDAVPWYQGIEMFMGLKRLQKPTWLLNYNGEKHGIMQRQNRKDFTQKMSEFFDFYLKNSPMPDWMSKGVSAVNKGLKPN